MYAFKILYGFLKENKSQITLFTFFTLLTSPLESIIIPRIYSGFFKELNKKTIDNKIFITYLGYLALGLLIINVSYIITSKLDTKLVPESYEYIMNYIYRNLLYGYENNYSDLELGRLFKKMNDTPFILTSMFKDCIFLFPKVVTVLAVNIYFFFLNPILGLVSTFILLLFLFINGMNFNKCTNIFTQKEKRLEETHQTIQDKLTNLFSIYSFGNIKTEVGQYESKVSKFTKTFKDSMNCTTNTIVVSQVVNFVNFFALSATTVYLFISNKIPKEMLISIFMTIIYYTPIVMTLCKFVPDFANGIGFLTSIDNFTKELYESEQSESTSDGKEKIKIKEGRILIHNLSFGYNENTKILDNIYLDIPANQKIALLGGSGSGKSTLIKVIMGYYEVADNTIFIDDVCINKYNLSDLRKQITFVNQNTKLFHKTVLQNIQYGNKMTRSEIEQLCKSMQVDGVFETLENGLDTDVGVNGDKLSGGQRQMVHILRNMSRKNKIIILDEPTSAIDVENKHHVVRAVEELSKNSTVILITHDTEILYLAGRSVTLNNGKVVNDANLS